MHRVTHCEYNKYYAQIKLDSIQVKLRFKTPSNNNKIIKKKNWHWHKYILGGAIRYGNACQLAGLVARTRNCDWTKNARIQQLLNLINGINNKLFRLFFFFFFTVVLNAMTKRVAVFETGSCSISRICLRLLIQPLTSSRH